MKTVGIVGASGYAGGELVRLLARHPYVRVGCVVSNTYAGKPFSTAFPGLAGTEMGALTCQSQDAVRTGLAVDFVFLAQENGAAMKVVGELLDLGRRVVDISADFRLRDIETYEKWYRIEHEAADILHNQGVAYGLPELNRDYVVGAHLVANPGCYPTATILALAPLLSRGMIRPKGIVVDAKSGVSGAGRAKSDQAYRYAEANESVKPYGIAGTHRHVPEIEQELSAHAAPENVRIVFTPHLIPMTRGILVTCYAPLASEATTTEDLLRALHAAYDGTQFVVVRDVNDPLPATKDVYGSNYCHLTARVDTRTGTAIVVSVIDNLVKGAAGQAIQNMNLMLGFPETAGLEGVGIWP